MVVNIDTVVEKIHVQYMQSENMNNRIHENKPNLTNLSLPILNSRFPRVPALSKPPSTAPAAASATTGGPPPVPRDELPHDVGATTRLTKLYSGHYVVLLQHSAAVGAAPVSRLIEVNELRSFAALAHLLVFPAHHLLLLLLLGSRRRGTGPCRRGPAEGHDALFSSPYLLLPSIRSSFARCFRPLWRALLLVSYLIYGLARRLFSLLLSPAACSSVSVCKMTSFAWVVMCCDCHYCLSLHPRSPTD